MLETCGLEPPSIRYRKALTTRQPHCLDKFFFFLEGGVVTIISFFLIESKSSFFSALVSVLGMSISNVAQTQREFHPVSILVDQVKHLRINV